MVQVRATLRVAGMFPGTKQACGNFRMEIITYFLYLRGSNLPDIVSVFLCFSYCSEEKTQSWDTRLLLEVLYMKKTNKQTKMSETTHSGKEPADEDRQKGPRLLI